MTVVAIFDLLTKRRPKQRSSVYVSALVPLFCAAVFGLLGSQSSATDDLKAEYSARVQPLFQKYCWNCHNAESNQGKLDLTKFTSLEQIQADFRQWSVVLQQIEDQEMPPKNPLPNADERKAMAEWIKAAVEAIDWSKQDGVGRVTLPRLTKAEYNHTLRDLLGIDLRPGDMLLDDGQGLSGFNNDRDALFISPALAEQLFEAADYALESVLALKQPPISKVYQAETMLMTERGSRPEDLPGEAGMGYSLAGAGQRTLYDEVVIPADGWYRLSVQGVGIGGDSGMRLRIDDEPRHDFYCVHNKPEILSTELLMKAGTHQMTWNIQIPSSLAQAKSAADRRAARATKEKQTKSDKILPANAPDLVSEASRENVPRFPTPADADKDIGNLVSQLNRALLAMQFRIEYLRLVTPEGREVDLRTYYNLLPERTAAMAEVKKELMAAMKVSNREIDRRLLAANRDKIESNQKVLADSMEVLGLKYDPEFLMGNGTADTIQSVGAPGVDWIKIEGPILPSGSQQNVVARLFGKDTEAGLQDFLSRAFRRPLRGDELARHLKLYQTAIDRGQSHEQGLKLAYTAALTSPGFLFRDELGSNGEAFRLDDYQLANRLSYFLWMSMPDEELFRLAESGRLHEEAILVAQVERMIADPKLRAFSRAFLGQWLGFSGLGTEHVPDGKKFRDFSPELAEAMKLEPILVFEELLRNRESLRRLLDDERTYANSVLASLYELPGVHGSEMRPVRFDDDRRGGLLGMAAILTASATPNRTSPVLRGKWVLENLLGRTLPEAPADAGQLDDQAGDRGLTLREELAQHRRHESCAGCHDKIDPIGFGLENFDAIGRYRSREAGKPVDAGGELPGGLAFNGPSELRTLIKTRYADEFMSNLTRRLASFAMGRALRPEDEGFVRRLLDDLSKNDFRADSLVKSIVLSQAFQQQAAAD